MAKKIPLVVLALVFLPTTTWADPPNEEVVNFYQSLKKAPEEIEASGMTFGEKMREAIAQGNPESVAQMKVALVDVLLTLHRIKSESKLLKVIPSLAGKDLYAAVDTYLKQQEKTIAESGPEIIRIAADGTLAAGDKKTKIQAIVEINRKGAALVEAPFIKALTAFARENGLAGDEAAALRAFTVPDQSCKVQMPEITENKTSETNGVKNTYYLAEDKEGVFMLSYADIAPQGEDDAALQKRLEEGRTGMIKKLGMKVTRETPLTLAGKHPGRELEGDLPDNKTITRIRMFIANGRLYQLWVVGPPAWTASANATRFLQSLELTK